jgi:exodeoxyribonuclease V alpha subunit
MSGIASAITAWVAQRHPAATALATALAESRLAGDTAMPLARADAAQADELVAGGLVVRHGEQVAWKACAGDEADIAARLRVLASQSASMSTDGNGQDAAVKAVVARHLVVITGGPGTGKTTTVLRALAALLATEPAARIAVCAPTGKAASRLRAAMERGLAGLQQHAELLGRIAAASTTVHRLLGWEAREARFRHRASHRLPVDVVVVDEASMLDIHLMAALCRALPATARLVLVGDDGQLPSVEAGAVLRDVVAASAAGGALAGCCVRLTTVHRQVGTAAGLRALAPCLRVGDVLGTEAVLAAGHADCVRLPHARAWPELWTLIGAQVQAVIAATDPAAALVQLDQMLVLCAHRQGPWSVADLHRRIEAGLGAQVSGEAPLHRHGRPVLVTANDHATGLSNGDIGVLWDDGSGLVACFSDGRGGVRRLAAARLPPCDTGWVVTVHKAQGSEAATAIVILPPEAHPLASRELLYTAVTRARERVVIVGDADLTASALARRAERCTGLPDMLHG